MTSSRQVLVRDIPDDLQEWIASERIQYHMSQQEFLIAALRQLKEQREFMFEVPPLHVASGFGVPFRFIDLFAGIGGFRFALQAQGGKCVFTSEWDKYAQKTYRAWHGEMPHGDLTKIDPIDIPDHDVLAAGFPCQPFSLAGVSKKNSLGRAHGFLDETQGTLFFTLAKIVEKKRPPVLLLENVKNLQSHDKGRTWQVIQRTLEELNYWVFARIIDAKYWTPQHRERIYIVCFDRERFPTRPEFEYPEPPKGALPKLVDILDPNPEARYTLTDHLWTYLQNYAAKHQAKGNGFGFGLAKLDGTTRTLSARYHKDGSEILIPQEGRNPRRLTPAECARLMGYPEGLPIVVSDTQAYRQFGNSVVVPVATAIAEQIAKVMVDYFHANDRCLIR
jgi:DNA (cytosine-5)-methyltransferase 1